MPKKTPWPRTSYVDIPEMFWKGIDRKAFSRSKEAALHKGDLLAPIEVFVMDAACQDPFPSWVVDHLLICFYRFLKSKGRKDLDTAFFLRRKQGVPTQWEERDLADRNRELTGEMYKLIHLGIDRDKAAKAISETRRDLNPPAWTSLEQTYYREGWAKLWARHFDDSVLRELFPTKKAKKAFLKKYGLA